MANLTPSGGDAKRRTVYITKLKVQVSKQKYVQLN